MDSQKKFKITSYVMLGLGALDILSLSTEFLGDDGFFGALTTGETVFLGILLAVMVIITLSKIYMGAMGLKYCNGTGKGTFHITLAKIGLVLSIISLVISVLNIKNGTGFNEIIDDLTSIGFISWYLQLAKENLA